MNPAIEKDLRELLDQLPAAQQRQVLEFARALAAKKHQTPSGRALSQFGGTISEEDLALIAEAIDEGYEQLNADEVVGFLLDTKIVIAIFAEERRQFDRRLICPI